MKKKPETIRRVPVAGKASTSRLKKRAARSRTAAVRTPHTRTAAPGRRGRRVKRRSRQTVRTLWPPVSVVIPAMNEAATIAAVVAQARTIAPQTEVVVVDNGSTDGTGAAAKAAGARVLTFPEPLGHDVGRSIGAKAASGDILLFLDGDMVIPAARLRAFVAAVAAGADIALNDYSGPVSRPHPHSVVVAKHGLNVLLGRPDLKGCSLTAVPHALSRRAATQLGDLLAVPPVAQTRAVLDGLRVVRAAHVPVGRLNAARRRRAGRDPLQDVVVADHLAAAGLLLRERGPRAGFADGTRRRELVR